ncbi:MAG: hypothetical protein ABI743_02130 [bacterium]
MPIQTPTFDNRSGGNVAYKALSHPLTATLAATLRASLALAGPVALVDLAGLAPSLTEFHAFPGVAWAGYYVQDLLQLDRTCLGMGAEPLTAIAKTTPKSILVTAFEAERAIQAIRHLFPAETTIFTLDALKLPDHLLTNAVRYLDPLNFVTNFALFRDWEAQHTRLTTANYWANYGGRNTWLWCRLYDESGEVLVDWETQIPDGPHAIVLDSAEIRARFGLPAFNGQLFLHAVNTAGHDVMKYVLDCYGTDHAGRAMVTGTHDANAWPSSRYAGLPAPRDGEEVVLWLQNSHPSPIAAGEIGLAPMGSDTVTYLQETLAGFATRRIAVSELLPDLRWPGQCDIHAGKHVVRPRYEVVRAEDDRWMAHVNVQRDDLAPDPALPGVASLLGTGYILAIPILPLERFRSIALPTPMSTGQTQLPLVLRLRDRDGHELRCLPLGTRARGDQPLLDFDELVVGQTLDGGYGHAELSYDLGEPQHIDGWLHALLRYQSRTAHWTAESSFGSHLFNLPVVFRSEPQSYVGRPPGLSTRLFVRLAPGGETLIHLIYPASTEWHATSTTTLHLHGSDGAEIASTALAIPCHGSRCFTVSELFGADMIERAGEYAYLIIRDTTCRLFGYQAGITPSGSFGFDHLFGF